MMRPSVLMDGQPSAGERPETTAAAQVSKTAEIARVEATPASLALSLQVGHSRAISLDP